MNTPDNPLVYIVVLNWNGWQDTMACLESLYRLDYVPAEILVVDNASTDSSVQKLKEFDPELTILQSDRNIGFSGGNNLGIRHALQAGAEYIWLLNNDTVVDDRALSGLIDKMQNNADIGICGSSLIYYHNKEKFQALGGGRYNSWLGTTSDIGRDKPVDFQFHEAEVEKQMDYVAGASMLLSRGFLEDIGLLNEEYFLYYEEVDLAVRAGERYRLGYAGESIVYHKEGASTKANSSEKKTRSLMADYYQIKNRLKFTWTYFPGKIVTVYLTVLAAIVNRVLRGQWDRIPMIVKLMVTFNSNNEKMHYLQEEPE